MQNTFHRSRFTWFVYILLAFYGYYLNILGPITPFLRDELHLSYTISSLHFTAFAVGMLVMGLLGHVIVERIGRIRSLWIGAAGICLGSICLILGQNPVLTIGSTFLMGCIGTMILVIVPGMLSDMYKEMSPIAISEANMISSLVNTAAPLLVGWFSYTFLGWRFALILGVLCLVILFFFLGRTSYLNSGKSEEVPVNSKLPFLYWVYWFALVLAVSIEFCMVFWSAIYLENEFGLVKADAAQAVSLFLMGMITGRFICSRLAQTLPVRKLILGSILLASIGFILYWIGSAPWVVLTGLTITGLGVAGLYPLIVSLAINSSGGNTVQASARASLASGTAIFALPLLLGRIADQIGLRQAYGIVAILLITLLLAFLATKIIVLKSRHKSIKKSS